MVLFRVSNYLNFTNNNIVADALIIQTNVSKCISISYIHIKQRAYGGYCANQVNRTLHRSGYSISRIRNRCWNTIDLNRRMRTAADGKRTKRITILNLQIFSTHLHTFVRSISSSSSSFIAYANLTHCSTTPFFNRTRTIAIEIKVPPR